MGIGLSFQQTHIIILQYFSRYKAIATGIAFAGGTVGSFIFPPILELILNKYGLQGCFLIMGSIMLNALPFALLLRPANPGEGMKFRFKQISRQIIQQKKQPRNCTLHSVRLIGGKRKVLLKKCTCKSPEKTYLKKTQNLIIDHLQAELNLRTFYESRKFMRRKCICIVKQVENEKRYFKDLQVCEEQKRIENESEKKPNIIIETFKNQISLICLVLRNPLFIILSITHVSFQWG